MFLFTHLQRYAFVHGLIIGAFIYLAFYVEYFTLTSDACNISCTYKLAWIFPLPYTILTFLGLLTPERERQLPKIDVERPLPKIHVCTVTKGANVEAIERVVKSMSYLTKMPNVQFTIVTDENKYTPTLRSKIPIGIHLCATPTSFVTKKAKYKSRALEYFRQTIALSNTDWVLHLDEESVLDEPDFRECLRFANEAKYPIGQGVILYNSHEYFKRPFMTVLDGIRVSDDLGRFRLQYKLLHVPPFGFHGSFLLVTGQVENAITWDHEHSDNLTEDFAFAMKCWDAGFRCGAISGVVREVSPSNLVDFFKQRRRWFWGVLTLPYKITKFLAVLWMLGVLTITSTYFHLIFSIWFSYPTPVWMFALSSFSFVVSIYMYLYGILIQSMDHSQQHNQTYWPVVWHMIVSILLIPFCPIVESACVIASLLRRPKTFDVIRKA